MSGRGRRRIAPSPRLRFPPLEIFAQRQFQPVLSRILRANAGLSLAFVLIVLHAGPVRKPPGMEDKRMTAPDALPVRAGMAAQHCRREIGNPARYLRANEGERVGADFGGFCSLVSPSTRLRQRSPCGKNRLACRGLRADSSNSRACCRSSVVEHSIGNGEVDSSILSGSTIHHIDNTGICLIDF